MRFKWEVVVLSKACCTVLMIFVLLVFGSKLSKYDHVCVFSELNLFVASFDSAKYISLYCDLFRSENINKEVREKEAMVGKYQLEIRQRNDEVEKKMYRVDRLNKIEVREDGRECRWGGEHGASGGECDDWVCMMVCFCVSSFVLTDCDVVIVLCYESVTDQFFLSLSDFYCSSPPEHHQEPDKGDRGRGAREHGERAGLAQESDRHGEWVFVSFFVLS